MTTGEGLPYQDEADRHPGIDPRTGQERSVLEMLARAVELWRKDGSLVPDLPDHDRRHDPDRDGWSTDVA